MTDANTGNGDSRPLQRGPSTAAPPVIPRTIVVATTILSGRSHLDEGMAGNCGGGAPKVANVRPSALIDNVVATARPGGTTARPSVSSMNAPTPSNTAVSGERDGIARRYAKQNAATPARPSTVASA